MPRSRSRGRRTSEREAQARPKIPRILTICFTEVSAPAGHVRVFLSVRICVMSVSSVTPPPIAIVAPNYDTTQQQDDQTKANDSDSSYQPPPAPPLPPGQGT